MLRKLRNSASNSDSLFLTIPRNLVEILNLKQDQEVDISLKGSKIILSFDIKEKN